MHRLRLAPAPRTSRLRCTIPSWAALVVDLVGLQPRITRATGSAAGTRWRGLIPCVFLAGVYGGYFSAAQGVILLGILGILMSGDIQGHNALKNILQTVVNIVAAGLIALGSLLGALAGAAIGKRIPVRILRAFVVVFGVAITLLMGWQAVSS